MVALVGLVLYSFSKPFQVNKGQYLLYGLVRVRVARKNLGEKWKRVTFPSVYKRVQACRRLRTHASPRDVNLRTAHHLPHFSPSPSLLLASPRHPPLSAVFILTLAIATPATVLQPPPEMIPSLAAWAGLGAGDAPPTPPPPGNGYGDGDEAMPPPSPSDPAEIRRKRLEKMMGSSQEGIEPMEMSTPTRPSSGTNMSFTSPDLLSPNVSMDLSTSMELEPSVLPAAAAQPNFASTMPARLSSEPSPNNLAATMPRATSGPAQSASPTKGGLSAGEKRVRRRSQILRRVLMVSSGSGVVETGGFVKVEFGGEEVSVHGQHIHAHHETRAQTDARLTTPARQAMSDQNERA